jgi:hypothetical protein
MVYGSFWHNQPAREYNPAQGDDHPGESFQADIGPIRPRGTARGGPCTAKVAGTEVGASAEINAAGPV